LSPFSRQSRPWDAAKTGVSMNQCQGEMPDDWHEPQQLGRSEHNHGSSFNTKVILHLLDMARKDASDHFGRRHVPLSNCEDCVATKNCAQRQPHPKNTSY
jgi:hypothetical protein